MLISFSGGPDESSLSEGVGRKRNSGLLAAKFLDNSALQGPPRRAGRDVAHAVRQIPPARRNPSFSFTYAPNSQNIKELDAFSYSFRGRPAINTISSSRTTIKKKGAAQGRLPEPEAKQRTNKCQPIQILLSVPKRVCNTN